MAGIEVEGVDICSMLETLNKRIEVLYDREHTLGHAFFMPLKRLLKMLRTLRDSPFKDACRADIHDAKMPLLEVYINQFLALTNQLVKRGIRSDYVKVQNNSKFLKGWLLVAQQIRKNSIHSERFYIEHSEYQVNRPANRLIKTALMKVPKLARSESNWDIT